MALASDNSVPHQALTNNFPGLAVDFEFVYLAMEVVLHCYEVRSPTLEFVSNSKPGQPQQ